MSTLHTTRCLWTQSSPAHNNHNHNEKQVKEAPSLNASKNKAKTKQKQGKKVAHLRAVRSLSAGPSLSPRPVVRWDSVRSGKQPPSILLSRKTCINAMQCDNLVISNVREIEQLCHWTPVVLNGELPSL